MRIAHESFYMCIKRGFTCSHLIVVSLHEAVADLFPIFRA